MNQQDKTSKSFHKDWDLVLDKFKSRDELERFILIHDKMFAIIKDILSMNINKREMNTSTSMYDSPSWAYTQADRVGEIRMLKYFQSLLTVEE